MPAPRATDASGGDPDVGRSPHQDPGKETHHEAIVLGGGPAGCAAALVLARSAHRVALVRPGLPPAAELAESVPPSARRVLEEIGASDAVEAEGFHPNRGNVVWWAGSEPRREVFAEGRAGFHAARAGLEGVLVRTAAAHGVHVVDGMSARSARQGEHGWSVRCEGAAGRTELHAPWVIDATGRHGLLARTEGREPDRSTTTLALVRRWRRPSGWGEDRHLTLVESYRDGWAWSVPLDDGVRCVTAMVDQRAVEVAGSELSAVLEAELAKTEHVRATLTDAIPEGDAWACPAALYTARRFGREGLLLAGDAGSFIDPLSSFGVKKALSSGWLAGVAVHTALTEPRMASTAVDFFDIREREVYRRYRAASVPFFETAAETHGTPYWTERAEAARRAGGAPSPGADPDRIDAEVPEAAVRSAFDEIRSLEELRAIPGATLRTFERPGIDGQRIVLQEHLGSEAFPEGMRWVRGVDLRTLTRIAPEHPDVPDGWSAYNAQASPVPLPDYLTALATAFAAGFLEHGAGTGT